MAGRTKKTIQETKQPIEKETVKEPVKKQETPENEMSALKRELEELRALIKLGNVGAPAKVETYDDEEVVLVSLYDGTLNLWTEKNNSGELYKFTGFGEEQPVPLNHAKSIIRNQKSFLSKGYFYIENSKLHKDRTIRDSTKNILEKEAFVNLMSAKPKNFEKLFADIPQGQKKVFADVLVAKIVEQENVDMNIVKIVGDEVDMDLFSVAEGIKYLRKNIDK
jgi:hypothetical protein